MVLDDEKITEFLKFQISRKIINLYKNYLILLEDLKEPPYNIPEEKYVKIRKKILDLGNDAEREISESLDKFQTTFKK